MKKARTGTKRLCWLRNDKGWPFSFRYRLLAYMVEIWKQWLGLTENKNAKRLPAVIPIVLFQGEKAWSSSCEFLDLMDLDDESRGVVGDHLPRFRFLLDDLSQVPDEALKARALTPRARLALALLRHARHLHDFRAFLDSWAPIFMELVAHEESRVALDFLLYYMLRVVSGESRPAVEKLMEEHLGEIGREAVQTVGDLLIQEGIEKGIEKGIAKGELRNLSNNILKVLEKRGLQVAANDRERIRACTDLELAGEWFDRALDAKTAQDIFGTN